MPSIDHLLLITSVLLILSVLASKTSGALGVPATKWAGAPGCA
jgi:NhaP-type Na+/H+ and K+/H+ antiporter